ncbi:MAG: hydrogenase 4 subunit B [Patescibacteria group bacterium]
MTIITSQIIFLALASAFLLGGIGALFFEKGRLANIWGNSFAALGSLLGIILGGSVLVFGNVFSYSLTLPNALFSLSFKLDFISAFFVFVISLIAFLCSIFAFGYVKHFYGKYNIGALNFFYNLFILGMILVATAHNSLLFLIVWEIMSLASYFLVIYERKEEDNLKAGSLYFIMTHIGTAFIALAFLLLYKVTGSFEFAAIKEGIIHITPFMKNAIFLSALIGFGIKAGIIPLHIWLPSAHPAAPSHVSALMSGVMIKTGIYMFIRMFFDILPNAPLWWGIVILVIGAVSSLLGVLYALSEHDIKRLLAYHSIENIGIILLGMGSSLVFLSFDMKALAALGLMAAFFHTLNHATFKALLFLGAGSVVSATHTRNIEEYGGLIRYMPQTAFFFLVGSMAISALPPFNGFFSEWMTFQSLFQGISVLSFGSKLVFMAAAGSLAFTGGLAAACFVKAFGATFLARPRSEEAKHAKEPSVSLKTGMAGLALLTVVFGVFSGSVSSVLLRIVDSIAVFGKAASAVSFENQAVSVNDFAYASMLNVFFALIVVTAFTAALVYFFTRNQKVKTGITWDCGTTLTPRMEITATGFSRSIITIFKGILKPTRQTEVEYQDAKMRYFPKYSSVLLETPDLYREKIYEPFQKIVTKISENVKKIQNGNVNAYILYIIIALIGLLITFAI